MQTSHIHLIGLLTMNYCRTRNTNVSLISSLQKRSGSFTHTFLNFNVLRIQPAYLKLSVPGYVFSLLCADNETWSVHTRCALLLLSGGQTTLWVLHHHNQWQVEPAGVWRPLHKHCLFYFFTAMELRRKAAIQLPWSRYRLRPACLLFYLFICLFSTGTQRFSPLHMSRAFFSSLASVACKNFNLLCSAGLLYWLIT